MSDKDKELLRTLTELLLMIELVEARQYSILGEDKVFDMARERARFSLKRLLEEC